MAESTRTSPRGGCPGRIRRQFRRPPPAARAARGAGRGRPLLFLLRRALHRGLPDRHRHPALHPRDPRPDNLQGRGRDDPRRRTSWAACAPASARPRRCARRPACANAPRASRSRSACCSATPPTALMAARRAALHARAPPTGKRVAVVGAGPAGLACAHRLAMLGHDVDDLRGARRSPAASTNTASPPTRRSTTSPQPRSTTCSAIGGIDGRARQGARPRRHARRAAPRLRRGVPRHGPRRRQCARHRRARTLDGRRATRSTTSPSCARPSDLATLPVGRRVVVIGGGMTAIDVAVQSKRLGAEEVTIVYRRGPEHMRRQRLRAGAGADQRRHDQALGAAEAAARRATAASPASSSNTRADEAAGSPAPARPSRSPPTWCSRRSARRSCRQPLDGAASARARAAAASRSTPSGRTSLARRLGRRRLRRRRRGPDRRGRRRTASCAADTSIHRAHRRIAAEEEHDHGRPSHQFRRHQVAEPVLARLGAADRQGVQRRARLRGGLGRRGLEDARRGPADRQRQRPALRRDPLRRPAA